jgi:hypothetical protein
MPSMPAIRSGCGGAAREVAGKPAGFRQSLAMLTITDKLHQSRANSGYMA